MTDDPLLGPRLRIQRAYGHLNEIEVAIRGYLGCQPYHLFTDLNADKSKHIVALERVIEMPETVPLMVSDCIHNFRSALDLLAVCVGTKNDRTPAGIEFPIKRSPEAFEEAIEKAEIKLAFGADGIALLKKLGPYKGSHNEIFWFMHHLDRRNKHIGLNTVGGIPIHANFQARMVAGTTEPLTFTAPKLRTLGKKTVVFEAPNTGTDFVVDGQITLDVTFGDVEGIENAPVVAALRDMGLVATHTLARFEREIFAS